MKKILYMIISSMLVSSLFIGCGKDKNSSASRDNQVTSKAPVVTSEHETSKSETYKNNPDFQDLDKNNDGILDDSEIKNDMDNIGDDIETIIDDAGNLAEDIISDVLPDNNNNSNQTD